MCFKTPQNKKNGEWLGLCPTPHWGSYDACPDPVVTMAVLGKIFGGPGPSSFERQQWLSEITIEPIKNLGAWARFGGPVSPALA